MDEFGDWRCGVNRLAVCHCHYLCKIGDWTRDYGTGKGNGLTLVANPAFASTLVGTGGVAKVRCVPDSAIASLTKHLQPCAVPSISATITAKTRFLSELTLKLQLSNLSKFTC